MTFPPGDRWAKAATAPLLKAFAQEYNGPDKMDVFLKDCRKYAALDIIYLGMVQKLSASERFFLGLLAKKMLK